MTDEHRPEPTPTDGQPLPTPREPVAEPVADDRPTALRDRWWWSPVLSIVVGLVVIGYQWEQLTGPGGISLNWVVAAIGAAVALTGVVRLVRAYPR